MKTPGLRLLVVWAATASLLMGCAMGTGSVSKQPGGKSTALEDQKRGPGPPLPHSKSHFTSAKDFFQWVNVGREKYASHRRACGHPNDPSVKVKPVGRPVFPLTFTWDDELAFRAKQEADRLARGGMPRGVQFTNQAYDKVMAWGDGYFTNNWMLTAFEEGTDWARFPLGFANGRARMGLWYQDFFETGPVITRLGIGASATPNGTWWVLQFGE